MISNIIFRELIRFGVDFVVSVPSSLFKNLLDMLDEAKEILHVPVTREEEGVGIAAGAYLGGKTPALIMQNSGLGNSINALASLNMVFKIPLLILIAQRGGKGETIPAQIPMGKATPALLDAIGVPHYTPKNAEQIPEAFERAKKSFHSNKVPVAVLIEMELMKNEENRSY
ncbi:MAG: sulfopyruvate decarboxylase subunit alpha [Candidatus Freyarchaeota archaeon]|nr:sulfopyruvate decarboxylase subunit alpha [Candidatus Jordarchaeia archaeon]MBS7267362.1 sulfopyruvate decarboxylase subunit alpha [Candidatus Jordarchaeia archaeon]MBS7278666.1 sulfopyruvate decarboxylase subunit alpha [Candidatus Jordarchaeia archaeon]